MSGPPVEGTTYAEAPGWETSRIVFGIRGAIQHPKCLVWIWRSSWKGRQGQSSGFEGLLKALNLGMVSARQGLWLLAGKDGQRWVGKR